MGFPASSFSFSAFLDGGVPSCTFFVRIIFHVYTFFFSFLKKFFISFFFILKKVL